MQLTQRDLGRVSILTRVALDLLQRHELLDRLDHDVHVVRHLPRLLLPRIALPVGDNAAVTSLSISPLPTANKRPVPGAHMRE